MEPLNESEAWPCEGDSLFSQHHDWKYNAYIGEHKSFLYENGYMHGAETLLASLIEHNKFMERDSVIYPALFLFHHNIELRLKRIIEIGNRRLNHNLQTPKKGTHKLEILWPLARAVIEQANVGAEKTPLIIVDGIIKELINISISSEGYRFPLSLEGVELIKVKGLVNVKNMLNVIRNVNGFFSGVTMQMEIIDDTSYY